MLGFVPKHFFEYWVLQSAKKSWKQDFSLLLCGCVERQNWSWKMASKVRLPQRTFGSETLRTQQPQPTAESHFAIRGEVRVAPGNPGRQVRVGSNTFLELKMWT